MRILLLCILVLSLQGCLALPIIATGVEAIKFKRHRDEVREIKEFRQTVLNKLETINKKLERIEKDD